MSTTKTLEQFQSVYSTIEEWYADLTGAHKSWVDDNWMSMMDHFVEYADQSLQEMDEEESEEEEEKSLCDKCEATLDDDEIHRGGDGSPYCHGCYHFREGSEAKPWEGCTKCETLEECRKTYLASEIEREQTPL